MLIIRNIRIIIAFLTLLVCAQITTAQAKPNIIFIFSDDHRYDLLGSVNQHVTTPYLDKLAETAVRFEHAYVTTAICSPSRAASLSGRYGSRNGVSTLGGRLNFPKATFVNELATAGYRTIHVGKWHLGTSPASAGFQQFASIYGNGDWFRRSIKSNIPGMAKHLNGRFYETVMADVVINQITDHTTKHPDQPFFLWWCNQVPHVDNKHKYPDVKKDSENKIRHKPLDGVGGYHADYNVAEMAIPASWSDDLKTKPSYLRSSRFITKSFISNYGGIGGYSNPAKGVRNSTLGQDNVQQHQLEYNAAITALDAEIGRVLACLDDPNDDGNTNDSIIDNTWIIFMGDNGWQTGSHKFTSKVLPYEESIRVPLLIKAPGVNPRVESKLALNIDLPATFFQVAGLPIPSHLHGRSLKPLLENTGIAWRESVYIESIKAEASLGAKPHDAIRTAHYKYIRNYNTESDALANTGINFEELYDLTKDPIEMINLAKNPSYNGIKAKLTKRLEALKADISSSLDPKTP
ncbi:MAG: sulfatase-like hydrolase/transferase [Akkermansiaceae bacterium]